MHTVYMCVYRGKIYLYIICIYIEVKQIFIFNFHSVYQGWNNALLLDKSKLLMSFINRISFCKGERVPVLSLLILQTEGSFLPKYLQYH